MIDATELGAQIRCVQNTQRHRFEWTGALTSAASGTDLQITVNIPTALESFSSLHAVLEALLQACPEARDELLAPHHPYIRKTTPLLINEQHESASRFFNAGTVGSAIVRRISRESIYLSDAIDRMAQLLLELHMRVGASSRNVHLVIQHAEHMDRPSLRTLYRAFQLSEMPLHWTWRFTATPLASPSGSAMLRRFEVARRKIFTYLAERMQPTIRLDSLPSLLEHRPVWVQGDVHSVAQELVHQNYDLAYLRAHAALEILSDPDERAHVHRMIAIVDANVGEIDAALESIHVAYQQAHSAFLLAHIKYMTGLIITKRKYNMDEAERAYRDGLSHLDQADALQAETQLERAWLMNGLALVSALRAKSGPEHERERILEAIFVQEAEAYKSVLYNTDAASLYLQLNLLANMTLLLEIKENYAQAARFWSRVFDRFRGLESQEARAFEISFQYRLGMLYHKAGQHQDALACLASAVELSNEHEERFTFERLLYALGYVALRSGQQQQAQEAFERGVLLAWGLRDLQAVRLHATGLAESQRAAGDARGAAAWQDLVEELDDGTGTAVRADSLPTPSPKFPSYVPLIDLEATPLVDLNRYLVSAESVRPIGTYAST